MAKAMPKTTRTFEECKGEHDTIAKHARRTPEQKKALLRELMSLAVTFDDWLCIFYRSPENDRFKTMHSKALKKLSILPATNEQMLESIEIAPLDSPLRTVVKKRLALRGIFVLNGYETPYRTNLPDFHGDTGKGRIVRRPNPAL